MIDLQNPVIRKPRTYVSAAIPFAQFGNERALTDEQLADLPWVLEFFKSFRHCFAYEPYHQIWIYRPI